MLYYVTTSTTFDALSPKGGLFTPDYDEAVRIFAMIRDMHTFPYIAVVDHHGTVILSHGNTSL